MDQVVHCKKIDKKIYYISVGTEKLEREKVAYLAAQLL